MLNLRKLFAEAKEGLTEKSHEALDRHKQVSQYLKTSHIKKNRYFWNQKLSLKHYYLSE
jgi:hypothetical protein